jgi:ANTAR domain
VGSRVGIARPEGRRMLDLAEGILIGLRRYSADAAFAELISVARRHAVSVSAIAAAVVAMAIGDETTPSHPDALKAAQLAWSDLFTQKETAERKSGIEFADARRPTTDNTDSGPSSGIFNVSESRTAQTMPGIDALHEVSAMTMQRGPTPREG